MRLLQARLQHPLMHLHCCCCCCFHSHAGPRGFFRGVQAANAVGGLAREYLLSGGQLDPPQTVLRKLFERLGATYIK